MYPFPVLKIFVVRAECWLIKWIWVKWVKIGPLMISWRGWGAVCIFVKSHLTFFPPSCLNCVPPTHATLKKLVLKILETSDVQRKWSVSSYYTCVCNLNPRSHWKYAKYIFVLKNDKIIWRFMYIIFEEEGLYSLFLFNTFLTKLQPWFLDNTPFKKIEIFG